MLGLRGESPLPPFLDSTELFFGLNSEYLQYLHKEINVLVKIGNFNYSDIMKMPTFSRRIFLKEYTDKED